jgi:hypothetical protein
MATTAPPVKLEFGWANGPESTIFALHDEPDALIVRDPYESRALI